MQVDQLNVRDLDLNDFEKDLYEFLGPISVSFTMKMRGVPFEAGEKEIYDVRLCL